jgi:hypothetical protein
VRCFDKSHDDITCGQWLCRAAVERLEVAVQSGSEKVTMGGHCADVRVAGAVGMVWPHVAGRGKAWQWLCKDPERPMGAAARPCQVTIIWDDFGLHKFLTNLRSCLSQNLSSDHILRFVLCHVIDTSCP